MIDLEIAKQELIDKNLNLVIVKNGNIVFTSNEFGVRGLVKAIKKYNSELDGSSVADTMMGCAAAMLCKYAVISNIYTKIISKHAINFLKNNKINFEYDKSVPKILNKTMQELCPFEKIAINCKDEKECYNEIKNFLSN